MASTKNVPVGQKLKFARELEKRGAWPPDRIRRKHSDVSPATPYLVIAADADDNGQRPLSGAQALHNGSVKVLDTAGIAAAVRAPGREYVMRATIRNLGAAPCYAGIVEFLIADHLAIGRAVTGSTILPPFAIQGFTLMPGESVDVTCPRRWMPATPAEAAASVFVQAYDLLLDPVVHRYDAQGDRHVGRQDSIPEFAGTWEGYEREALLAGGGTLKRLVIAQTGLAVMVQILDQSLLVPGSMRQLTGSGTIAADHIQLMITEMGEPSGLGIQPVPFTTNAIDISMPVPDSLHVTTHRVFVGPGDAINPQDLIADLKRA